MENNISLNIRVVSIENLIEYSKVLSASIFEIKINHELIEAEPLNANGSFIRICPGRIKENEEEMEEGKNESLQCIEVASTEESKIELDFSFSINFDPTDIEELNHLIDAPVVASLIQIQETDSSSKIADNNHQSDDVQNSSGSKLDKYKSRSEIKDVPSSNENSLAAYASIDLLSFVTENHLNETTTLYLYPKTVFPELKTPVITIEISCPVPLFQIKLPIGNFITITLEDIFNPPRSCLSPDTEILVETEWLSRSLENGIFDMNHIATYSKGKLCKYLPNDLYKKWNQLSNINSVGLNTSLEVSGSIAEVYNPKNVDLKGIDANTPVWRYNSIFREFLTSENCKQIKNFISYHDEHMLVEIRFEGSGHQEKDVYLGTIDISPMLFPNVKTGRFAIPIKKFIEPDEEKSLDKVGSSKGVLYTRSSNVLGMGKATPKKRLTAMIETPLDENTFIILEISFKHPMEEYQIDKEDSNENYKYKIEALEEQFEKHMIETLETIQSHKEFVSTINNDQLSVAEKIDQVPYFAELQANMTDTIMKLVASKYNRLHPTTENASFMNLMANVHNDLSDQLLTTVNNYYCGCYNTIKFKDRKNKDFYIFNANEFREFGYEKISNRMYKQLLDERPGIEEETIIDLVIADLQQFRYEKAATKINELLLRNPRHIYGLIIRAYIDHLITKDHEEELEELGEEFEMDLEEETEKEKIKQNQNDAKKLQDLQSSLLNIALQCPENVEIWALLYALYKQTNHRTGFMHSQMMFTKNSLENPDWMPFFSVRSELYFQPQYDESVVKNCIYIFLKLGAYKFAEILYKHAEKELLERDKIVISSVLNLLLKKNEKGLAWLSTFERNSENKILLQLYKGHFLYALGNRKEAIMEYQVVYHSPESQISNQHLIALRCGFADLQEKHYATAKTYFSSAARETGSFLSWYGLGVCFFRMNEFDEANACFSRANNIYQQFGELWIYLVMLNLKQNKTKDAFDCYENAKKYYGRTNELWREMVECFNENNIPLPESF